MVPFVIAILRYASVVDGLATVVNGKTVKRLNPALGVSIAEIE